MEKAIAEEVDLQELQSEPLKVQKSDNDQTDVNDYKTLSESK